MTEIVLETQERQLVSLYRKLPRGEKQAALDFLFGLVEKEQIYGIKSWSYRCRRD